MSRRHVTSLALSGVLALSAGISLPSVSQAATADANASVQSAGSWLADQLDPDSSLVFNPNFGGFTDYGLSIDILLALNAFELRPGVQAEIVSALNNQGGNYLGFGASKYAGSHGKLAVAALAGGQDPTAFAGTDLIADLEGLVVTAPGNEQGRAKDSFDPQDPFGGDFSNAIGQSFVVRALDAAGSDLADETLAFLLKQQCEEGFFRVSLGGPDNSCDGATPEQSTPSVDATALAVLALDELATTTPATTQAIADAVTWLKSEQNTDGSFGDDGAQNTNSTGLAAAVLSAQGATGPAANAAGWVLDRQVSVALADNGPLSGETGAIARGDAELAEGAEDGIVDATRDSWRRASAQAVLGLAALLPRTELQVTTSATFAAAGKNLATVIDGLVAGERFTVTIDGLTRASGFAAADGSANVLVKMPLGTVRRTVLVTGSRESRVGSLVVRVLGMLNPRITLSRVTVAPRASVRVRAAGFVAGEPVRVVLGGARVRVTADGAGVANASLAAPIRAGRYDVKVTGAFANRTGSVALQVR